VQTIENLLTDHNSYVQMNGRGKVWLRISGIKQRSDQRIVTYARAVKVCSLLQLNGGFRISDATSYSQ